MVERSGFGAPHAGVGCDSIGRRYEARFWGRPSGEGCWGGFATRAEKEPLFLWFSMLQSVHMVSTRVQVSVWSTAWLSTRAVSTRVSQLDGVRIVALLTHMGLDVRGIVRAIE